MESSAPAPPPYRWMLFLVIYTFEMLTTRFLLSGFEWVMLNVEYSQVTKSLLSLIKICSLCSHVTDQRSSSTQDTIRSLHRWSTRILRFYGADQKHLTQKFNEAVLVIYYESWWTTMQCPPVIDNCLTFISSPLWSSSIAWKTELWRLTSVIPLLSKAALRTCMSFPNYAWSESTAWWPRSVASKSIDSH